MTKNVIASGMNFSENVLRAGAREVAKKAASWGQVCKQISGISGKVAVGDTTMKIKDLMAQLGVVTGKNAYKAADINAAWAEGLKEAVGMYDIDAANGWRTPLIVRSLPYTIHVGGKMYKAFDKDLKSIHTRALCRVVKAEDRRKGSTDVVVSAPIVLEGLVQSVFVDDTLRKMREAQADCELTTKVWVNVGKAAAPVWKAAIKDVANDEWSFED